MSAGAAYVAVMATAARFFNTPDAVRAGDHEKEDCMNDQDHKDMQASKISAEDIGRAIEFHTVIGEGRVNAFIRAELRQVYHTGSSTAINVTGFDMEAGGALSEFVLQHTDVVRMVGR